MPGLSLFLPTDVSIALRRFANDQDTSREVAAATALREFLIGHGYLEVDEIDEETVTEGSA